MFPYGALVVTAALLASASAHAVPIKISRVSAAECDVCNSLERDTFGLDAKRGFGHHPYPAFHRTLSNRSDVAPMTSIYLQNYQVPQIAPLSFGSWGNLAAWLRQTYLRPGGFYIPGRDTRPPTSVPEPSSIALMLLGIGATVAFTRRAALKSSRASA